ncbi:cyclic pyranopterin monophosphate synthase MoaC [Candidatus Poribacteria bacterium]|nr:cyclic pyranopterin monophosphate synthase MoaC [Candidatus Poribacteria bacterium]
MEKLTHFNKKGQSRMVDVTQKEETIRIAIATGKVLAKLETLQLIADRKFSKGDVLEIARVAGIMATKRTADLIPLCHPIPVTGVEVNLSINHENQSIDIEAEVQTIGRTGVEMEALTAVSIAALTIYDMCKSVDREMEISAVYLTKKTGGKSGTFTRQ